MEPTDAGEGQPQDQTLVKLANNILSQLHINQTLTSASSITGSLFVTMYEALCGEILADAIRLPQSIEDDIHNTQAVIDALALEVLHTSLSHISGEAVARGDRVAVANLLDLFSSLVEFILNRIECDLSDEDTDHDREVTSELIDDILSRDLRDISLDKENYDADNSDQERSGELGYGDLNREDLEQERRRNSTLELIKESEQIEQRLRDEERRRELDIELRLEEERILFEEEQSRRRIAEEARIGEEKLRKFEEKRLVAEALARYGERPLSSLDLSDDASSEGGVSHAIPLFESTANHDSSRTPELRTPSRGLHSSLLSLTEETRDLSRSAVRNSPARQRAERSAFLEAAIRSALKKIDREAKGVEQLVGDLPQKKSVRLQLSKEFGVDVPVRDKSPSKSRSPFRPRPLSDNNNNADSEGIPRPSITISSPKSKSPSRPPKKSATVKPFHKKATVSEKTDKLKRLYAYDYGRIFDEQNKLDEKDKRRADNIEKRMRENLSQSSRKSRPPVQRREELRGRLKSASLSPPRKGLQEYVPKDSDLFYLLDAFPNLYLSSDTLHDLWKQSMKQLESLNKIERETKRKDVLHKQLEDAARRQNLVSEIFRKDLDHRRRMADLKHRQAQEKAIKQSLQEKRTQSARIRRYYQDFHLGMRAKMLNKRIRDELIFKKVFKDGLAVQRQSIRDMRAYAKEQREKKTVQQQNEIESLENFYRDQFMMLAEATQKERSDLATRQNAQSRVINRMKNELRHKMESEIRKIQVQIVEEDDGHFREMDAETLHQDLLLQKYKGCA